MKPPPFSYSAPDSLAAALELLAENGEEAKLLAGGQSLVPAMNFRVVQPTMLIDLNRIETLDFIQTVDGELRIGAMTRQRTLEHDPLVREHAPLLHETMPYIAHPQIRNRGTAGGSLVHADPAAELPVIALALDARVRLQSSTGERWVAAPDFFRGMFTTDLAADEMLVEIALPPMPEHSGWAFAEFARRHGDYALLGVAAVVTLDEEGRCERARLVYLNAGDGPVEAAEAAGRLAGEKLEAEQIAAAADHAAEHEIDPMGNVHAAADYQRHLGRVLTRRALAVAHERAAAALAG